MEIKGSWRVEVLPEPVSPEHRTAVKVWSFRQHGLTYSSNVDGDGARSGYAEPEDRLDRISRENRERHFPLEVPPSAGLNASQLVVAERDRLIQQIVNREPSQSRAIDGRYPNSFPCNTRKDARWQLFPVASLCQSFIRDQRGCYWWFACDTGKRKNQFRLGRVQHGEPAESVLEQGKLRTGYVHTYEVSDKGVAHNSRYRLDNILLLNIEEVYGKPVRGLGPLRWHVVTSRDSQHEREVKAEDAAVSSQEIDASHLLAQYHLAFDATVEGKIPRIQCRCGKLVVVCPDCQRG